MKIKLSFFFIILIMANSIIAQTTYKDCEIYGNCKPISTGITSPIISNGTSSNNSIYWNGNAFVVGAVSSIETDPICTANLTNYWRANTLDTRNYNTTGNVTANVFNVFSGTNLVELGLLLGSAYLRRIDTAGNVLRLIPKAMATEESQGIYLFNKINAFPNIASYQLFIIDSNSGTKTNRLLSASAGTGYYRYPIYISAGAVNQLFLSNASTGYVGILRQAINYAFEVAGNIYATGDIISDDGIYGYTYYLRNSPGAYITGIDENLFINTNVNYPTTPGNIYLYGNTILDDNIKAYYGTGNEGSIYFDGSNFIIQTATGLINLLGNVNFTSNNLVNTGNVTPQTTNTASIGSLTLRYLKGWFSGLDVNGNVNISGNLSVKRPYAMFSDTTTQVITASNTAQTVNFSTTEDNYLINIANDRQNITFQQTGDYLIELSAIFSVDTPNKHIELWVEKTNSTGKVAPVPRSNTKMELSTAGLEIPLAVPFIIDMNTTDVMRIRMASDDAGSELLYTTNTSYSPATPSIIMTISKISEIT